MKREVEAACGALGGAVDAVWRWWGHSELGPGLGQRWVMAEPRLCLSPFTSLLKLGNGHFGAREPQMVLCCSQSPSCSSFIESRVSAKAQLISGEICRLLI